MENPLVLLSSLPMEVEQCKHQRSHPYSRETKASPHPGSDRTSSTGFFETHPVGEVVRSLFFSSILWMLLAIVLYGGLFHGRWLALTR